MFPRVSKKPHVEPMAAGRSSWLEEVTCELCREERLKTSHRGVHKARKKEWANTSDENEANWDKMSAFVVAEATMSENEGKGLKGQLHTRSLVRRRMRFVHWAELFLQVSDAHFQILTVF